MADDEEEVDELPENLDALMRDVPFFLPEDADEQTMLVVKRGAQGLCCMCSKPLGKNTLLMLGADGIKMAFCSGACLVDMQLVGWLQMIYDDIVQQVKFRGGHIDPDGPPGEGDPGG
jgi:hypothetical protein